MKKIQLSIIALFLAILFLPLSLFNFEENFMSNSDNRYLTNNPLGKNSNVKSVDEIGTEISNYVDDRIGLRNEMINAYNYVDSKFFQLMTHPYYMKGKDGYIFHRKLKNAEFDEYHENFARMIININEYCKKRDVPFIFVFEPEKLAVVTDKAPEWMNYDNGWTQKFMKILTDNGVPVVDNTKILKEKYEKGEKVFNKQYDGGHWNDLGCYYGVNNILSELKTHFPDVRLNTLDDFNLKEKVFVEQQQAGVYLEEKVVQFTPKKRPTKITSKYSNTIKLDKQYHYFYASKNSSATSPKTLVFQGSYMNVYGYKFLANALSEYYAVHDYANILEFEYYYEYFKPECVIFEVAEYTFTDLYFNAEKVKNFHIE